MDFLANENFPLEAVFRLRNVGHDVPAIIQDSPGASDEEILEQASRENRIILTFDSDYGRLLYEEPSGRTPVPSGVVYFRFDPSPPEEPAERLLDLLEEAGVSIAGSFTVVERDRIRRRPLPDLSDGSREG